MGEVLLSAEFLSFPIMFMCLVLFSGSYGPDLERGVILQFNTVVTLRRQSRRPRDPHVGLEQRITSVTSVTGLVTSKEGLDRSWTSSVCIDKRSRLKYMNYKASPLYRQHPSS